jgi:hypothetical protein
MRVYGCNKKLSINSQIKINRHLGIKKYKCNYNECDMSFVSLNRINFSKQYSK